MGAKVERRLQNEEVEQDRAAKNFLFSDNQGKWISHPEKETIKSMFTAPICTLNNKYKAV